MGNFWLDQIELEEIAEKLADFLINTIGGKALKDPKEALSDAIMNFFLGFPKANKYQHRINVEAKTSQVPGKNQHWITDIKVVCN
jgi:hypothetical protein